MVMEHSTFVVRTKQMSCGIRNFVCRGAKWHRDRFQLFCSKKVIFFTHFVNSLSLPHPSPPPTDIISRHFLRFTFLVPANQMQSKQNKETETASNCFPLFKKMADSCKDAEFHINFTNSFIPMLVIGNGNIVNNCCRRLQYDEHPTASRSRRMTAIQDGSECREAKRIKKQAKITFPQRKFRREPKRVNSESEEDNPAFNAPEIFPPFSEEAERKIAKSLSKSLSILTKLHPLRDSGNWKEFDSAAESILLENQGDLNIKTLIALEKSVVVSYHNNLEQAEAMVLEALKILQKSKVILVVDASNYHFLVAMAHLHLTGFYRRQNKHGQAEESIAIADQNSMNLDSRFLKALIFYEMASNLTKYISSISNGTAREQLVARAEDYMKQCISLCLQLDDGRVYIRKHHFGLLKLALMGLNCRTRAARSQHVSSKCIEDAKNCLKTVEEKYEAEMSEGQQIQLLVAKSDLKYRLQNFQEAEELSIRALTLAEQSGFDLEVSGINERLDDISRLIRARESMSMEIPSPWEECADSLSSSTSPSQKNSPYSSGCEMEVD